MTAVGRWSTTLTGAERGEKHHRQHVRQQLPRHTSVQNDTNNNMATKTVSTCTIHIKPWCVSLRRDMEKDGCLLDMLVRMPRKMGDDLGLAVRVSLTLHQLISVSATASYSVFLCPQRAWRYEVSGGVVWLCVDVVALRGDVRMCVVTHSCCEVTSCVLLRPVVLGRAVVSRRTDTRGLTFRTAWVRFAENGTNCVRWKRSDEIVEVPVSLIRQTKMAGNVTKLWRLQWSKTTRKHQCFLQFRNPTQPQ